MGYYPILLDLAQRPCLVIGGGSVAERKVERLLQAGAAVTVISPTLTERLDDWVKEGRVRHEARRYQKGDLAGYQLAFVATDDPEVNTVVYREGREREVWVNAADDAVHCDFILPSVLRRGELVVAVATGGSSPALSRAIREELEAYFTEDYGTLAEIVAEVRRELKERSLAPSAEAWQKALNGDLRRLIRDGKQEEAKNHLLKRLGAEICG
ncbi:MAG: bifunctional precorrin-2 dehydrogenase/sirohydrochlorin ferrochelatase [Deltaproteobacteria bacterium]|nr:bifunctional precorrin-2 dehydrogenase/sirohydrochlorin ferrochelatase [Deltaproteobacteria bacterium]